MQCPIGKRKVYHVTTPERVLSIKREGLKASCHLTDPTRDAAFAEHFLKVRRCSNYAWADLSPTIAALLDEHPVSYPPPIVEACVDEKSMVYNMEFINRSQDCVWDANDTPENIENMFARMKEGICQWKESGVPLKDYKKGQHRLPEILFGDVPPEELRVVAMTETDITPKEREDLLEFIEYVREGQQSLSEKDRQEMSKGAAAFEANWAPLLKEQWDKVLRLPQQDDIECSGSSQTD